MMGSIRPPGRARMADAAQGAFCGLAAQFFRLCMGAGIRPPRATKSSAEPVWQGITGAEPSSPPNSTVSQYC